MSRTVLFSLPILGYSLNGYEEGLARGILILCRVIGGVSLILFLSLTTPVNKLLLAANWFRAPKVLVELAILIYRYIFVLIDQVYRMKRARDSRNFGRRGPLWNAKIVGHMIGVLFIRTYEKAERIYAAMASRGFDGEVRTLSVLKIRSADVLFALLFYGYAMLIWGIGPLLA